MNIVPRRGGMAGAVLDAHPDVAEAAFTGSHLTGRRSVQASAEYLKGLSLELGGRRPDVVFADADLAAAFAVRPCRGTLRALPPLFSCELQGTAILGRGVSGKKPIAPERRPTEKWQSTNTSTGRVSKEEGALLLL